MNRIVKWIKSCAKITKSSSFLDVGCGNGLLLVKLVGAINLLTVVKTVMLFNNTIALKFYTIINHYYVYNQSIVSQSVNQHLSVSQSVSHCITNKHNQSTNQPTNQPTYSTYLPTYLPTDRPTDRPTDQPTD